MVKREKMIKHLIVVLIILLSIPLTTIAAFSNTLKTLKGGYIVALYEADLITACVVANDEKALLKMFNNKQLYPSKAGLKVYVTGTGAHGIIKFRPIGVKYEFWTFPDAVY